MVVSSVNLILLDAVAVIDSDGLQLPYEGALSMERHVNTAGRMALLGKLDSFLFSLGHQHLDVVGKNGDALVVTPLLGVRHTF